MSDKVFTFMAKHCNHKLRRYFWQKPVSARSGAQTYREASEKLKTNAHIQVCLFVLSRKVVETVNLSGLDYRLIVAEFLILQHQEFLGCPPSEYYPGPTMPNFHDRTNVS